MPYLKLKDIPTGYNNLAYPKLSSKHPLAMCKKKCLAKCDCLNCYDRPHKGNPSPWENCMGECHSTKCPPTKQYKTCIKKCEKQTPRPLKRGTK